MKQRKLHTFNRKSLTRAPLSLIGNPYRKREYQIHGCEYTIIKTLAFLAEGFLATTNRDSQAKTAKLQTLYVEIQVLLELLRVRC